MACRRPDTPRFSQTSCKDSSQPVKDLPSPPSQISNSKACAVPSTTSAQFGYAAKKVLISLFTSRPFKGRRTPGDLWPKVLTLPKHVPLVKILESIIHPVLVSVAFQAPANLPAKRLRSAATVTMASAPNSPLSNLPFGLCLLPFLKYDCSLFLHLALCSGV